MKMNSPRRMQTLGVLLAVLTMLPAASFALDATPPEIAQRDSVVQVEHHFVTDLPPDSVARLIYLPDHLIAAEEKGPGVLEAAATQYGGYDLTARFKLLWIYRNRMVLHRSIERRGDTLFVRSTLSEFWQTVGVAPEPTSSASVYTIVPRPYGGTEVTYTQRTAFHGPLGSFAYRYFCNETTRSLMDVVDYIRRFEPARMAVK